MGWCVNLYINARLALTGQTIFRWQFSVFVINLKKVCRRSFYISALPPTLPHTIGIDIVFQDKHQALEKGEGDVYLLKITGKKEVFFIMTH